MKVRVGFGLSALALAGWNESTFFSIVDACEEHGWDSIWFSERVSSDAPDPVVAMAAVAGRTRRLKFGPSVMIVPGRNPLLLAKQLATLDVISAGRLVVAFGLGVDARVENAIFAVDRSEAAARTDEAVTLMRLAWTQDRITFAGRFHQVTDVAVGPRPAQKPHPDVWFGGVSSPALRRTGRLGDGWLPSFVTVSEYSEKAEVIRKIAADEGRRIDDEHFGALVPYLPAGLAGEEQVLAFVAKRRPGVDPRAMIAIGGPEALRARLAEFVEQGASKFVITPVLAPPDWQSELATLREEVAKPLEV